MKRCKDCSWYSTFFNFAYCYRYAFIGFFCVRADDVCISHSLDLLKGRINFKKAHKLYKDYKELLEASDEDSSPLC